MIHSLRRQTWLLAIGIVASCSGSPVFGQGNTFNPYGNSGYADYREFTVPMLNNDPSLPGQARLQSGLYGGVGGGSRSNQFESYTNSLESGTGDQTGMNRGTIAGVPYYKAARYYAKDDRRAYRANAAVDQDFRSRLAKRNADYNAALAEKDPRKRALMIQKIERNALDAPAPATAKNAAAQPRTAKAPTTTTRAEPAPVARRAAPAPAATTPAPASRAARPVAPAAGTPSTIPPAPTNPSPIPIPAPR